MTAVEPFARCYSPRMIVARPRRARTVLLLGATAGILAACGARTNLLPSSLDGGWAGGSIAGSGSVVAISGDTNPGMSGSTPTSTSGQSSSGTPIQIVDASVIAIGPPCPSSCVQLGAQCGVVVDRRCGGAIDCGTCAGGVCGAQIPNVCSPVVTPMPDAGAAMVIADNLDSPSYIAVDANNIYWTTYSATQGGSVMTMPLGGGRPAALASGILGRPGGLALDTTSVYWTSNLDSKTGVVMKVGIQDRTVVALVTAQGSFFAGPAVAFDSIYWSENASQPGAVWKAALDGTHSMVFASNQQGPGPLTHDATNLYWATPTGIWSAPLKGGLATFLGGMPGGPLGSTIAVDNAAVYSIPITTPLCTIWRTPLAGGSSRPLSQPSGPICVPFPQGRGVAADGTSAYWTAPLRQSGGPNYSGSGLKTPTAQASMLLATATTIADGQNVPWGIAVDAKRVYWTNYGGRNAGKGQVMAAPK